MLKVLFYKLLIIFISFFNILLTMELPLSNTTLSLSPQQPPHSLHPQTIALRASSQLQYRYRPVQHDENIFCQSKSDTESIKIISQKLKYIYLNNNGRIYGFFKSKGFYHLHAWDEITGKLLWHIPAGMNKDSRFALCDDKIYLTLNNKEILIANALSGDFIGIFELNADTILELNSTVNGNIYVHKGNFEKQSLTSFDQSGRVNYVYPLKATRYSYYLIGESLGIMAPLSDIIEIFDPAKSEPHRVKLDKITQTKRYLASKDSLLFYGTSSTLICYDLAQEKQLWELDLSSSLSQNPLLSADKTKIFIATNRQVVALCLKSTIQDKPSPLWEVTLNDREEYEIKLSNDAQIIYCLGVDNGILFKIDCVSGNKKDVGEFKTGRTQRLIGINNNNIYIQQHIF